MPSGDLGELASLSNEPSWMTFEDPATGNPYETELGVVRFLVMGQDSETFLKIDRQLQNKRLKQNMLNRKNRGNVVGSAEQWDEDEIDRISACVINFENVVMNGQKVEYAPDVAKQLIKTIPALRRQLADFIMEASNFFKKS